MTFTVQVWVAMELWFLFIGGGTFYAKGVGRKYSNFYEERVKSFGKISDGMPSASNAYKKFMNENVFGKGEKRRYTQMRGIRDRI